MSARVGNAKVMVSDVITKDGMCKSKVVVDVVTKLTRESVLSEFLYADDLNLATLT